MGGPGTVRSGRFRLLWAGQSVSAVGDGMAVLAVPLLVLGLTRNPVLAALAATPRTVGYLVAGLPAGPLVDRADSRAVMIAADLTRLGAYGAMAGLAAVDRLTVPVVFALAFVAAVATVAFDTAYTVLVQDLMDAEELLPANSRLEASGQVGALLGPAAVGLLSVVAGLPVVLAVNAATFGVSVLTLLGIPGPGRPPPPPGAPGLLSQLRAGLSYLWRNPLLRALAGFQFSLNFLLGVETLVVFLAKDRLGLPDGQVGLVVTAAGAGGVAGAALASRLVRPRPETVIAVACTVLGIALATMAAAGSALPLGLCNAVVAASAVAATVHIRALRQRIVPRELLGRVTSTARTLALLASPVGAGLAGWAAAVAGDPRPVFVVAGAAAAVCAAVGYAVGLRPAGRVTPAGRTAAGSEAGSS